MRLTAFCVCGTLLAFSSLSRIRAEEGVLLGDWGFGPCTVTLRPAGACRPGEQDSTCPYYISLPPLVVHLPQHFLDLENIMQDLQKLKDTVDELREMCADCTGGQAGRKCGRQSEADLKGGKSMHEDEGDWMNERLEENDRDFRQECGKEGVKVETKDGDNMKKKLNDRNKWETGGDVKENNREEPVTEGARGEDTLEELKMPTSGGNMQTVNVTREQIAETNPKGSARKYQDDILEKNKEETKERGQPMWRDKTKKLDKNTKAEAFDRVKMSKNHTVNINKEQEQMEMEKGIKVDPNKKKPKQMERFGFTEKGRVIKTESVQKDGDGETSYSKTTEKTDFLSINLTTITTGLALRLDSSDTKSFTSSLPSPSLLSSTLSSITDVIPDPKAGYGLTRSTDPGAGGVNEPHSQDKATLPTTTATISTVGGPREQITNAKAGLTTTTPHQSSFITSSPRVIDGSRVAPKNISSKIKIALKPPPFRAPQPGEKLKSGIKPEAENRLKNAKNDHKRNQGPSIERKTKFNQKQKPHKPTVVRAKPDSKKIQNKKPGQRITPDISTTKENLKNNLMHKQEVAVNDPKSKQNSSTSVQTPAPQAVNVTHSGKYTLINRESDEVSNTDQNFKLEKKSIQLVIVDKSDQKSVKRLDSEEKLNETFALSQNLNYTPKPTVATNHPMNKSIQKIPTFNPEPEDILEFESTTKQNQKPLNESVGSFEDNITQEMKNSPDLTSGENINAHRPHTPPDNINDSSQEQLNPSQEFETGTATTLTESVDRSGENSLQEPKSNPDLTPAQASASDKATVTHDQKKNSSQHYLETKHKPETTQESSSESNKRETSTKTTNKKQYLTNFGDKSKENPSRKSENHPDLTPEQKAISDPANTTLDYMNKSSQEDHKPKHRPETNKEYKYETVGISKENSLQEFKLNPHLTPEQTSVLDQATNNPDQKNKSSEDHLKDKHKSENIQEFKSNKSETATPKPSTESVGMSEEKSCQKPTSNPGLRPRHRSTPDQAATSPDQMKKSSEEHPKDQKKTENIQELKSNQRETPKPNQKHLPESVDQSEDLQEPTPYPPYTPGQTSTTNQATTTTDQMDKSNRDHLKTQTSQESKFNKSETATQKPSTESWVKSDEASLQEPTSNPDLPPGQTSTMDVATVTTYQVIQSSQDHLKTEHNPDKIHSFISNKSKAATPKPDQKPLTESVDKSEDNSLKQTKLYLDLTHEQTSTQDQATTAPDIMNTFNNKYLKTQTSNEFKFNKNETASQKPSNESWDKSLPGPTPNPGLTSRHRSTLDLATATPNQMKKSTNSNIQTEPYHETKINKSETARQKPSTESWEKPEEESLQEPSSNLGLGPRETSTSDLDTATTDQINKSINDHPEAKHIPETIKGFRSNTSETATPKPNQKPSPKSKSKEQERKNNSDSTSSNQVKTPLDQRSKPSHNVPKFNKTPKPGQEPKQNQKNPKVAPSLKTRPNANLKSNQTQQTNLRRNTPRPGLRPYLKPILVPEKILKSVYNKTSKLRPPFRHRPSARPTVKPGVKPIQRLKEAVEPEPSPQTKTGPSQISWGPSGNIQTSRTDRPPTSSLVKQIAIVSHTPRETEFSTSVRKTITLSPKTFNSLETGYFPALQAHPEDVTSSPNTRITSDLRPQTAGPPSSVPRTTRPNKINNGILQNVFTSTGPGSTQPSVAPKPKAKTLYVEKSPSASPVSSPSLKTTSTLSTNFRPKTSSTSGPELPPAELSTPSPRELRVKINQVAAFVNNSLIPNGRSGELPKEQPDRSQRGREHERTDGKLPTSAASTAIRDCSDHSLRGRTRSGVYLVTPDLRGSSFPVFCDMELDGGGWTLLQRRQDGSVSFNRTWVEYQAGFGVLDGGEFWLGNNKMHLLTRDRDMVLRVELEDFDGLTEHAQYEHFRVASERLRYRLTVGGYSGTAGDALRFSRTYDHNNRMFTTPDRDHDRYPSGNCGAYYSSGWWFDACMAANLNGRYYVGKYKGVRDGIYWGTWHNISTEYYPTNERLSFKSVRMMIRPKSFGPR